MKQLLKNTTKKLIDLAAKKLGYQIPQHQIKPAEINDLYSKQNLLHTFYNLLLKANFQPVHIVDVGANHGTWTREILQFFPNANYSLLEPQHWMKNSIEDLLTSNEKINFYGVGAGKQAGNLQFTLVDRDDSCNFLMTEQEAQEKGYRQI